jgi:hypothetical protein
MQVHRRNTGEYMSGNQQLEDGPLAEFVALRQEIDRRSTMQHNLFALQLTASAVIFSFALSRHGWSGFLLIIPISTFMLSARYVDQMYDIQNAASYIRDELSEKVPGKLGWEKWLDKQEQSQECQSRKEAQFSQLRRRAALIQKLNCQDFDDVRVTRRVVVTGRAGGATAGL